MEQVRDRTARSRRWQRSLAAFAVAGLLAASGAGCAQIPTESNVAAGQGEAGADDTVSIIAAGPVSGASPDAIVRGFLLAAQAGPTATTPFAVAKEYLTSDAAGRWRPGDWVTILTDTPTLAVTDAPPVEDGANAEALADVPAEDLAHVLASGIAVASLNDHGVYNELPEPTEFEVPFTLRRVDGEWRIDQLDYGLVLPEQVFSSAFRQTRLYYASPDGRFWVPDVRWFPRQTWQTNAVQELFAGPPSWLEHSVRTGVPDGVTMTLDTVTQGNGNTVQVRVSEQVSEASEADRGLLVAQLKATLADDGGQPDVVLIDSAGPVPTPEIQQPRLARTNGSALAVSDDELFRVAGSELRPLRPTVSLFGLEPTALALGPGRDGIVVVRDGGTRLIRIDRAGRNGDENELYDATELDTSAEGAAEPTSPQATEPIPLVPPSVDEPDEIIPSDLLFEGVNVIAPSVDPYGFVWSGEMEGQISVVQAPGMDEYVTAPWLAGREINSLRVAPDGVRVAIVSTQLDEEGESTQDSMIAVAGIRRDGQGAPFALDEPKVVGSSLRDATDAVWQDDATLAVIASDGGDPAVFLVGVGGLDSPGGLPRPVPGVDNPLALTASVGTGSMLAIDPDFMLHQRQSTMWPTVGQPVALVAYPG